MASLTGQSEPWQPLAIKIRGGAQGQKLFAYINTKTGQHHRKYLVLSISYSAQKSISIIKLGVVKKKEDEEEEEEENDSISRVLSVNRPKVKHWVTAWVLKHKNNPDSHN